MRLTGVDPTRPGAQQARKEGCCCPCRENWHGKGKQGEGDKNGWYIDPKCPLHASEYVHESPSSPTWLHGAPGSPEARKSGCACAVMDNCHGRGRGLDGDKYGWYISGDCPVHGSDYVPPKPT